MIQVEDLTKRFGRKTVVDGLWFTAKPGRVTGFLGPNGAGKSTTMRMILGLDHPSAGRAKVMGHDYTTLDRPLTHVGALLDAKATKPIHHGAQSSACARHVQWDPWIPCR